MTREEAQRNLIYSKRWGVKPDDRALDMAIRSLEAWEKVKAEIEEIEKNYGFDKATKYGNKNAEQQNLSYSTMMMYEIAYIIDDIKEIIDKHLQEVKTDADSD